MRDYKFQRTNWRPQRQRRSGIRLLMQLLILLVAAGAGYTLFDYFGGRLSIGTHSANIIPLAIPPKPTAG